LAYFKLLIYKKKARDRVINFLYYCVTFIGKLKYRFKKSKLNRDAVLKGVAVNTMRLFAVFSHSKVVDTSKGFLAQFLLQAGRTLGLRERMRISVIRLLEVKARFTIHMQRKNDLKEIFMEDLSRHNHLLTLLNQSTGRMYVDLMDEFREQIFHLIFNSQLNQLLKRSIRRTIDMRMRNGVVFKMASSDIKFKETLEELASGEYYGDFLSKLPEYKLLEMVNERTRVKTSIYEAIAASCSMLSTEKKETRIKMIIPRNKALQKGKSYYSDHVRRRQGIIFDKSKLTSETVLTLGLSKTHYVCILLTMSDYFKQRHSIANKSSGRA
jgi:hypothetical protein